MGIEASYNFRRVSHEVTTSGLVPVDALAGLGDDGYQLLVNLLPDSSEHAVEGEERLIRDQGVGYEYIPVDFSAPTHDDFEAFAAVMDANEGKTIHVHCAANYRVSVFYGLYALRKGIWSAEDVDRHIESLWDPASDPPWRDFIAAERARMGR